MKRLFLLLAAVGLFATACDSINNGTDSENGGSGSAQKIQLSQTKKTVVYTEGEYTITVTSPCSWGATSKNSWITIESETGIAGSEELVFNVEANSSDKIRKGTIVIKNTDFNLIAELYVVQAANGQDVGDIVDPDGNEGGNGDGNEGGNEGGNGDINGGNGDGSGGNQTIPAEKKLVRVVSDWGRETWISNFTYDDQGRLIIDKGDDETSFSYYEWTLNSIRVETQTYFLSNGMIHSYTAGRYPDTYNVNFIYDSTNRLSRIDEGTFSSTTYTWNGDYLTSQKESDLTTKYTYNGTCNGYNPLLAIYITNSDALCLANPELIGLRTKHLVSAIRYEEEEYSEEVTFSYEFDSEGYISQIKATDSNDGAVLEVHTLTWK
ncbi:MAG: DUF4595 domain-containing protein [Alistipes sp.]|nr:DUF4595 domain-containing protein [Alistipes sp.]